MKDNSVPPIKTGRVGTLQLYVAGIFVFIGISFVYEQSLPSTVNELHELGICSPEVLRDCGGFNHRLFTCIFFTFAIFRWIKGDISGGEIVKTSTSVLLLIAVVRVILQIRPGASEASLRGIYLLESGNPVSWEISSSSFSAPILHVADFNEISHKPTQNYFESMAHVDILSSISKREVILHLVLSTFLISFSLTLLPNFF